MGCPWPAVRETLVRESGIPRADFVIALDRLRCGEDAASTLDDRFVAAFAIAGALNGIADWYQPGGPFRLKPSLTNSPPA